MTPRCANCRHFDNAPATLEAEFPGLSAMSSGFASVRDSDGICARQGVYLPARARCDHFVPAVRVGPPGFWQAAIESLLAGSAAIRTHL